MPPAFRRNDPVPILARLALTLFWIGACWLMVTSFKPTNDHFDRISRARQIARYGDVAPTTRCSTGIRVSTTARLNR